MVKLNTQILLTLKHSISYFLNIVGISLNTVGMKYKIGFGETFTTGPLLGFSIYDPTVEQDYTELNIYLIFLMIHIRIE